MKKSPNFSKKWRMTELFFFFLNLKCEFVVIAEGTLAFNWISQKPFHFSQDHLLSVLFCNSSSFHYQEMWVRYVIIEGRDLHDNRLCVYCTVVALNYTCAPRVLLHNFYIIPSFLQLFTCFILHPLPTASAHLPKAPGRPLASSS